MTSISQNPNAGAAWLRTESPAGGSGSPLRDLAGGLLTVRQYMSMDERGIAQLETLLRIVDGTRVGATLLRAISTCDIHLDERPVIVFEYQDVREAPVCEGSPPDTNPLLYFTVVANHPATNPSSHDADYRTSNSSAREILLNQAVVLFAQLTDFYAHHTGQSCPDPYLGFGDYSMLTFRDQLKDPVDQWQRDIESYIREAAGPDENRTPIWRIINNWLKADKPEQPLRLNSLGLTACPPLQNLPCLERLELVDNRLAAFPPGDRLPPTLAVIDLANNPIRTPASSHGPALRRVTLDRSVCENTSLCSALPAKVEIIEADPRYLQDALLASRFETEFPDYLIGRLNIEAMEATGWTNEVMAQVYPRDMLESAVENWLQYPSSAWRRAQEQDPNRAAALATLIDRLHKGWRTHRNEDFRGGLVALLSKMEQAGNERFMHECLAIAFHGSESCDDQMFYTLNNLYIASLNYDVEAGQYDKRILDLMYLGEDMLNLHTLTQFFAGLMPELQLRALEKGKECDEVEQFLHLQRLLKDTTHLPTMRLKMQFEGLSWVTEDDAQKALAEIQSVRQAGYIDFLASWSPLQSVIERLAPDLVRRAAKWRDHIYGDRGTVYGVLDRLLMTNGSLFASPRQQDMDVFTVGRRRFWTRYDRLVDRRLSSLGLTRDMPDVLPQACAAVSKDIALLIQTATTRAFLDRYGLKTQQSIREAETPGWFKRLSKKIR